MGLFQYIKETRAELNHVTWPTREQAIFFTIMIIIISIGVALFLGFFDYLFSQGIQKLILK